jgi:hypothetical protein
MNMSRLALAIAIGTALCTVWASSALAALGPTSTLYLMNYGEFSGGTVVGLDVVQGATVTSFPTGNALDIAIAAAGDIRTTGYGFGYVGSRFSLAGSPLAGGPYTNPIKNSQLHDGTSDGLYNYAVDYATGDVTQFDRYWASPVALFNPNGPPTTKGTGYITMNAADGSFWLSWFGGPDLVQHFSHTWTPLGSFNSGVFGSQGLALDPVDGTLWMSNGGGYTLYQFSQAGTPLQSLTYSGVSAGGWYGMEFDTTVVPVPTAAWMGGVVLMGMAVVRWLRRQRIPV